MYTSLERVVLALQHKEPDRVPVYPICSGVTRNLTGVDYYTWANNPEATAEALIRATDELALDCICTLTDLSVEAADFGQKIIYPANEAAHPDFDDYLLKTTSDLAKVRTIKPGSRMNNHVRLCELLMRQRDETVPVVAFIFGPLGVLSMLRGQENLFMDILDDPKGVKNAVEAINETLIEYTMRLIDTGVHAVMIDTLFASASIMSKDMWREFEGPYVKKWADKVISRDCMTMIHNCGKNIYFDAQIETIRPAAISFLHVPDDCKDMKECKERYGEKTALIGCIPPTDLPTMTTAQVEEECRCEIDIFAPGGGFMLATGCEYPANLSLDHAKTIVHMAKTYGKYPLDSQ